MEPRQALFAGAAIGLTVAAPIGPMAIIVIHRTLAGGFAAGLATGAGASTMHLLYAVLAVLGLNQLSGLLAAHRIEVHAFVAAVLLVLAVRVLRRLSRPSQPTSQPSRSILSNYVSAIAFSCVNPLGFVLFVGATAALTGFSSEGRTAACGLAAGVFIGSIGWWLVLVAVTTTVGMRLSPTRTKFVDLAAASVMLGLAASMTADLF